MTYSEYLNTYLQLCIRQNISVETLINCHKTYMKFIYEKCKEDNYTLNT